MKYLSVGDLTNANAAYSRMLSLRYDGDVLFGAAAQSSIDAVDQVDAVVAAVRKWSFTGAGIVADVACLNPWCGRAIEALDASTQWASSKLTHYRKSAPVLHPLPNDQTDPLPALVARFGLRAGK